MPELGPKRADYLALADALERNLQTHILSKWFPAAIVPEGGFRQDFNQDWVPSQVQSDPSLVYHSRLTYTASLAALHGIEAMESYARHGFESLRHRFWDAQHGGFRWTLGSSIKHTYGIAFAIYALSTYHRAFRDTDALLLANEAFNWLNDRAHDKENLGFFEVLDLSGRPIKTSIPTHPVTGDAAKSMNTHIHLLEAFAALHEESRQGAVRMRLEEVLKVLETRVFNGAGLTLFFKADWSAKSNLDSYGHDIETAYLLVEAMESLGSHSVAIHRMARTLVDHTMTVAWDPRDGGIFDEGTFSVPKNLTKVWWAQAESLNALLLMHEIYGSEDPSYWERFVGQWRLISEKQTDAGQGGWHAAIDANGKPRPGPKSGPWTDPYHQARALITCSTRLRKLAELGASDKVPPAPLRAAT